MYFLLSRKKKIDSLIVSVIVS